MDATNEAAALILVVDDDWMNREVMEAHLRIAGYEVILAHGGEDALQLSREQQPDLILLDVRMQGMSGYTVCTQLRAQEATRHIPVVMVTGLDSDEERQKGIDAGADDFIQKPFSSLTMLTRVKSLVRISCLQRELETLRQQLNAPVEPAANSSPMPANRA